ncbi:MAG: HIT domain-containing protein [Comamonadaceae bacterium]|nr:HIT domain-containing protein [Comamonadaceae bacterium]
MVSMLAGTPVVNPGHLLLIPYRHVETWFDASAGEKQALWTLLEQQKIMIDTDYRPDGYSIGINVGEAARANDHARAHHLIPRYRSDVPNPRGGVRGVIPAKQNY